MAKYTTPGVYIKEIDKSDVFLVPGSGGAAMAIKAPTGPTWRPVSLSNTTQLNGIFGYPVLPEMGNEEYSEYLLKAPSYGYGLYAASAYLAEGSQLTVVRACSGDANARTTISTRTTNQIVLNDYSYSSATFGLNPSTKVFKKAELTGTINEIYNQQAPNTVATIAAIDSSTKSEWAGLMPIDPVTGMPEEFTSNFGISFYGGPSAQGDNVGVAVRFFGKDAPWLYSYDDDQKIDELLLMIYSWENNTILDEDLASILDVNGVGITVAYTKADIDAFITTNKLIAPRILQFQVYVKPIGESWKTNWENTLSPSEVFEATLTGGLKDINGASLWLADIINGNSAYIYSKYNKRFEIDECTAQSMVETNTFGVTLYPKSSDTPDTTSASIIALDVVPARNDEFAPTVFDGLSLSAKEAAITTFNTNDEIYSEVTLDAFDKVIAFKSYLLVDQDYTTLKTYVEDYADEESKTLFVNKATAILSRHELVLIQYAGAVNTRNSYGKGNTFAINAIKPTGIIEATPLPLSKVVIPSLNSGGFSAFSSEAITTFNAGSFVDEDGSGIFAALVAEFDINEIRADFKGYDSASVGTIYNNLKVYLIDPVGIAKLEEFSALSNTTWQDGQGAKAVSIINFNAELLAFKKKIYQDGLNNGVELTALPVAPTNVATNDAIGVFMKEINDIPASVVQSISTHTTATWGGLDFVGNSTIHPNDKIVLTDLAAFTYAPTFTDTFDPIVFGVGTSAKLIAGSKFIIQFNYNVYEIDQTQTKLILKDNTDIVSYTAAILTRTETTAGFDKVCKNLVEITLTTSVTDGVNLTAQFLSGFATNEFGLASTVVPEAPIFLSDDAAAVPAVPVSPVDPVVSYSSATTTAKAKANDILSRNSALKLLNDTILTSVTTAADTLMDAIDGQGRKYLSWDLTGGAQDLRNGAESDNDTDLVGTDGWALLSNHEKVASQLLLVPTWNNDVKQKVNTDIIPARKRDALMIAQSGNYTDYVPGNESATIDKILKAEKFGYPNPSYAALYAGWALTYDFYNDRDVWLPNVVFAGQAIARTDNIANVWDAPAGQRKGIIAAKQQLFDLSDDGIGKLYTKNINAVKEFIGIGSVIWGQKTAQRKPTALDRINVRRTMLFIESALRLFLDPLVLDVNNTPETRLRVWTGINSFLQGLKSQGGLMDFQVICDDSNNTPDVIDANQLNVDVLVRPVRTVEFIDVNVIVASTGLSFEEARVR